MFLLTISSSLVAYHFAIYWLLMKALAFTTQKRAKDFTLDSQASFPAVSLIVTAHNEEKVIRAKIENSLSLNYPPKKLEIILADDWSTDKTKEAVDDLIESGKISYFKPDRRLGKTHAQNGAASISTGEILAFSDANSIWDQDALKNLCRPFLEADVGFVAGRLQYLRSADSTTGSSEDLYWRYETSLRAFESRVRSILTSNGAIYAVLRDCFKTVDPLFSHDSYMPPCVVSEGYRAVFERKAIASEMALHSPKKEFSRKVRMFGRIYYLLFNKEFRNTLKETGLLYRFMHFSHRTLRFLLPLLIIIALVSLILSLCLWNPVATIIVLAIACVVIPFGRLRALVFHFLLTVTAMLLGLFNFLTVRLRPFWEPIDDAR